MVIHRMGHPIHLIGTSLVAQTVKNLSAMQETQAQSLSREVFISLDCFGE